MFFSKVLLAISLGSISALATPHDLALQHRDDAAAGTPNSPDPVQPQLGNANGMNYAYVTAFARSSISPPFPALLIEISNSFCSWPWCLWL